jgi:hypothetical protein
LRIERRRIAGHGNRLPVDRRHLVELGGRRLLRRGRNRSSGGLAQGADGRVEREALCLEKACSHAAAVSDERGEHDRAIDARAPALLCG